MKSTVFAIGLLAASLAASSAHAGKAGFHDLNISGSVREGTVHLSVSDLEKLPHTIFRTHTPWHDGPQTFEGVRLDVLMDAVGAVGTKATFVAINDYEVTIPVDDFATNHPILAYRLNGETMSVRDKGPFFVVYDYDSSDDLQTQKFYTRSAWQVTNIEVEP
jgi:hypothetical protein